VKAPTGLQQGNQLVELEVASRPAMQQQQRHCIPAGRGLVHIMQVDAFDGLGELRKAVELSLPLAPVVAGQPVLDKLLWGREAVQCSAQRASREHVQNPRPALMLSWAREAVCRVLEYNRRKCHTVLPGCFQFAALFTCRFSSGFGAQCMSQVRLHTLTPATPPLEACSTTYHVSSPNSTFRNSTD
jgi:hypothetical protein